MDSHSSHIRTTIIIKFAYHPITFFNNQATTFSSSSIDNDQGVTETETLNAAKSCAVCGSRLHMTKHCPVHP
ncbi:hypothetical protein INT46_004079 [Mucor plumbeus]|uniref:Uncharacterized protein n=1 Tax=Mucor plumbeus TaxID=97098 RepID=A0A8H7RCB0_9FUNG|nr:hypothetical protein INT46_004079 [Mucor plumbeus]